MIAHTCPHCGCLNYSRILKIAGHTGSHRRSAHRPPVLASEAALTRPSSHQEKVGHCIAKFSARVSIPSATHACSIVFNDGKRGNKIATPAAGAKAMLKLFEFKGRPVPTRPLPRRRTRDKWSLSETARARLMINMLSAGEERSTRGWLAVRLDAGLPRFEYMARDDRKCRASQTWVPRVQLLRRVEQGDECGEYVDARSRKKHQHRGGKMAVDRFPTLAKSAGSSTPMICNAQN